MTITTLTTSATVGASVALTITGNFAARAIDNGSPVVTKADGDAKGENAAIGASVAVGYADHRVLATTASSFDALGHTVEFKASGNSSTETSATASANGASDASSGAATPDMQVASQRTLGNGTASGNGATGSGSGSTPPASSSNGSVTAAAAVAVNVANTTSSASLPSGLTINSGGLTLWSSAATDAKANADGSATAARGPPATIGAAVAINFANVTNSATVAGTANGPATVKALVTSAGDAQSEFNATATSGAGGGTVSVAGSLALNIVNLHTSATITGTVTAGAGDVSIAAGSSADSSADAHAAQAPAEGTGAASSLGIGAAVAVSLIDDSTDASLTGTLVGGRNLTLTANTIDGATSSSKTGAAGGNVSLVPSVAITLSNVTTTALVAPLADLLITGAFGASADQSASAGTDAEGDAEGSSAAIGVSVALTIANHRSEATLARNLTANGAVSLSATGSSDSSASATASASGAPEDSSGGAAPADSTGSGHAGTGVDDTVASQRSFADATSSSNGGSGAGGADPTPSAATSSGGVNVAAAVAINLAKTISRATLVGPIAVSAGGLFTLSTAANTDAQATADGSAVNTSADASAPADSSGGGSSDAPSDSSSGVNIGAAVAINYAKIANEAILPAGATVTSNGATIEALMNSEHELGAAATSGAGGGSVSVAGSLAIDIENIATTALIAGTLTAGTGAVAITATSNATSEASALPSDSTTSASSVGIGASVALAIVDDTTTALLGGTLNGGGDVTLAAKTEHGVAVHAKTGAAGGKVAIVPSVAIALSTVTTTATVSASATPLNIGGAFSASADQSASAGTIAEGDAQGASAAIGVSLALTIANHRSEAWLARDLTAVGAVSLSADGSSDSSASATASASGAPADSSPSAAPADPSSSGVTQQVNEQRGFANTTRSSNGGGSTDGGDNTPAASTSSGGVSVAAAVAVTLAKSWSRATLAGPITVNAGGRFTLGTSANTDAFARADGTAVTPSGGGGVSIGIAVAINKVDIVNTAILPGGNTVTSQGATIQALMHSTHTLGASAKSGAGGGSVGIAGSVAIDLENITTTASLAGSLNAGTGSVIIRAASDSDSNVAATPAEVTLSQAASTPQAFHVLSITDINPDSSDTDAHDPDSASGGRVNGLGAVAGSKTIVYAATEWGGLYKTTDGGQHWSFLAGHRPLATWDVEVDPSAASRVYATSFYDGRVNSLAGINVSNDAGATWTRPATATPAAAYNCDASRKSEPSAFGMSIRPDAPSNVFVGTNCGVAVSTDSGATWTFVDPTPGTPAGDIWDVVAQGGGPTGQGIVDVCGDDGHFRSTDGGLTWVGGPVGAGGTPGGPCSIAASPDEPNVLFAVVGVSCLA